MEAYFKKVDVKHRIRDPIYGFIRLTDAELNIVDTPLFQRLRRVHQLALTKYVYPSAEHSRFVHSLGVMHCATLILAGVNEHKLTNATTEPNVSLIKTLRFAALLHDIGHLPFSHAAEKEILQGLSHEDLGQFIICNYKPISNVIEQDGVDPKEVASLLAKRPPASYKLVHEIVSGQLDADRADYLLRDSHCCGVKYGEYDFARFLQIFGAIEDRQTGGLSLSVDENDLHVAESLLIARYHYNIQIPYHRTRSGFDFVLKKFISDFPEYQQIFSVQGTQLTDVNLEAFIEFDDNTILEKIKKEKNNPWSKYLFRGKHLIPIIDTTTTSRHGVDQFKKLVLDLSKSTELEINKDYFVQKQKITIIKEGGRSDEAEDSQDPQHFTIKLMCKEGKGRTGEAVDITERSWIFKHLTRDDPLYIYRLYVTPEKEKMARDVFAQIEE